MTGKIGYIEKILIDECKSENPSFAQINRLFDLGANPNAVNEYGECVLSQVFRAYCGGGDKIRKSVWAPQIVVAFLVNGFDVRRHGLNTISEMQNSIYDRNMRLAIKIILDRRRAAFKADCKTVHLCLKAITGKAYRKLAQAI